MSNNNDISVQTTAMNPTLQHPDGSEVTAQEIYDAVMSGRVMLFGTTTDTYYFPFAFTWQDENGGKDDPTNVASISIKYIDFYGDVQTIAFNFSEPS